MTEIALTLVAILLGVLVLAFLSRPVNGEGKGHKPPNLLQSPPH